MVKHLWARINRSYALRWGKIIARSVGLPSDLRFVVALAMVMAFGMGKMNPVKRDR
jgi:hypothetical protein